MTPPLALPIMAALALSACVQIVDETQTAGPVAGVLGVDGGVVEEREPHKGSANVVTPGVVGLPSESAGAEFAALKKFTGDPVTHELEWATPLALYVQNTIGQILVTQGVDPDLMVVRVAPTVRLPTDAPTATVSAELALLDTTIGVSAYSSLDVLVKAEPGALDTLGADVSVVLPAGFDSNITVSQSSGSIDIDGVEASPSVGAYVVESGDISLSLGALTHAFALTGMGDIRATFDSVSGAEASMFVVEGSGGIRLELPSAGAFSLVAEAGNTVSFGAVPEPCAEGVTAEASKTLTCSGGGAEIAVDATGDALNDVTVGYR